MESSGEAAKGFRRPLYAVAQGTTKARLPNTTIMHGSYVTITLHTFLISSVSLKPQTVQLASQVHNSIHLLSLQSLSRERRRRVRSCSRLLDQNTYASRRRGLIPGVTSRSVTNALVMLDCKLHWCLNA